MNNENMNAEIHIAQGSIIPDGCCFKQIRKGVKLNPGDKMPKPNHDDMYETECYTYTFQRERGCPGGWFVEAKDKSKTAYDAICTTICGTPVTSLLHAFSGCINMIEAPEIPRLVDDIRSAFSGCVSLMRAPQLRPNFAVEGAFHGCTSLVEPPEIPEGIDDIRCTFQGCTALRFAPKIPDSVTYMDEAFSGCVSMTEAVNIPKNVWAARWAFYNCKSLVKPPVIAGGKSITLLGTFAGCTSLEIPPELPSDVDCLNWTFRDCSSLKMKPSIPSAARASYGTFDGCTSLQITKIIVSDIEWDTDGEKAEDLGLPAKIEIAVTEETRHLLEGIDDYAEALEDYLSNAYGYCTKGFATDVVDGEPKTVSDILEQVDLSLGSEGQCIYSRLRERYGYQMLDVELFYRARADHAVSNEEWQKAYHYAFPDKKEEK